MFLGGLGLFMYGVRMTSDGLQKFAASKLKGILQSLTKRPVWGVLFGIVATVALQSSAATTVLVVEFVNAGMMNLAQALGIVLGSAVGTSITIQLLAFQMINIALGLIFVGFILNFLVKGNRRRHLGQALIGFGIIFVGMANMSNASAPLKDFPEVYTFLSHLGAHTLLAIVVGIILTAVIQSSTAVFAIMMSLAGQHLLNIQAIVPLVIGAHIGGTVTTLFSSITAQKMDAKRAALANTGYKVVAAILVYPFLHQFAYLVQWTTTDLPRQVANAHLLFALLMVVIFLPLNAWLAKGLVKLVPDSQEEGKQLHFKFIDESSLEVPAIALKQVAKEINALGQMILDKMMSVIPQAILGPQDNSVKEIALMERHVDWHYRHISRFLVTLAQRGLTNEQTEENLNYQFILKELEYVGDTLMSISQLVNKMYQDNLTLPQEEWESFRELYDKVVDNFKDMLGAMETWNPEMAGKVIREHPEIIRTQRTLRFMSFGPVAPAKSPPLDWRSAERLRYARVDLINLFYGIDEHALNIAQVVMGII